MKTKMTRCPKCSGMLYSKKAPYEQSKLLKEYFAETVRCVKCGEDYNVSILKFRPIK